MDLGVIIVREYRSVIIPAGSDETKTGCAPFSCQLLLIRYINISTSDKSEGRHMFYKTCVFHFFAMLAGANYLYYTFLTT